MVPILSKVAPDDDGRVDSILTDSSPLGVGLLELGEPLMSQRLGWERVGESGPAGLEQGGV